MYVQLIGIFTLFVQGYPIASFYNCLDNIWQNIIKALSQHFCGLVTAKIINEMDPVFIYIEKYCDSRNDEITCVSFITYGNRHVLSHALQIEYTRVFIRYADGRLTARSHEVSKFDRHLGSSAAEMPVKFQSDTTILTSNLAASRLEEILWW